MGNSARYNAAFKRRKSKKKDRLHIIPFLHLLYHAFKNKSTGIIYNNIYKKKQYSKNAEKCIKGYGSQHFWGQLPNPIFKIFEKREGVQLL